jgi:hypothetical protein
MRLPDAVLALLLTTIALVLLRVSKTRKCRAGMWSC